MDGQSRGKTSETSVGTVVGTMMVLTFDEDFCRIVVVACVEIVTAGGAVEECCALPDVRSTICP